MQKHRLVLILCCLVPLAALTATVAFNTPAMPTVLVALAVLAPLSYYLLRPDRTGGSA
jgi:hypothetical protein